MLRKNTKKLISLQAVANSQQAKSKQIRLKHLASFLSKVKKEKNGKIKKKPNHFKGGLNLPFDPWHWHVAATTQKKKTQQERVAKKRRINKKQCQQCSTNCVTGRRRHLHSPFFPLQRPLPRHSTCQPGNPHPVIPLHWIKQNYFARRFLCVWRGPPGTKCICGNINCTVMSGKTRGFKWFFSSY